MPKKKIFVSGCFDMLHSGHIRFLEEAAGYGEVHVGIGSDRTVKELKGRYPVNTQAERKYMLEALRHVKACYINRGSGIMDFLQELKRVSPDILVVNEDGNSPAKAQLCERLGMRYIVLKRDPRAHLPAGPPPVCEWNAGFLIVWTLRAAGWTRHLCPDTEPARC
jgi:cytidyltransferase-like protein